MKKNTLTKSIKYIVISAFVLAFVSLASAESFSGKSRVSSIYRPNTPENAGSTYERENYVNLYLGDTISGDRNQGDILISNTSYQSYGTVDLDEVFQLGQLTYTNGLETIDGTTPETLTSVVVAQINGTYRQFQFNIGVDNGEGGGQDEIAIIPESTINDNYLYNANGTSYTLELLGFGTSADNIVDSILSGNIGETTNFNAYGRLVDYNQYLAELEAQQTASVAVPTPAALPIGIIALIAFSCRRKHSTRSA
ncbi:choice-of-anchor K domain-containing protein [Poriferisphaera sp. WC338]|uniref:choice-of-anchor K domain-containing protein n=1 Tax=Poriferisphaera sp. WC338 TaxID=3425129 RepID=UPI003D818206